MRPHKVWTSGLQGGLLCPAARNSGQPLPSSWKQETSDSKPIIVRKHAQVLGSADAVCEASGCV